MYALYAPAELFTLALVTITVTVLVFRILYYADLKPLYGREPFGYGCKYVKYLLKQSNYLKVSFATFIISMRYFACHYDKAMYAGNTWDMSFVALSAAFALASGFAMLLFSGLIIFGTGNFMDKECDVQGIVGDPYEEEALA